MNFRDVENYRFPELDVPARPGWKVTSQDTQNGPDYRVKKDDDTEAYRLTNRHFKQVDAYMSHKLLALLLKKIKENPGRKVVVLDVGGGVLSECLHGMLRHPFLKGKLICINVDLFAQPLDPAELAREGIDPRDLIILNENFLEKEMLPGSADVVFSYQVLDMMPGELSRQVLEKVGNVLAPNGEAYINDNERYTRGVGLHPWYYFPGLGFSRSSNWMQSLADRENLTMTVSFGETELNGATHIMVASLCSFIYMGKTAENGIPPIMSDFSLAFPEIREAVKRYG